MTDDTTPGTAFNPPTPNPLRRTNEYPPPLDGTPNWRLINATREFIAALPVQFHADTTEDLAGEEFTPDGWVQEDWRCLTGMCYAGWASALTGAVFPYAADDFDYVEDSNGKEHQKRGVVQTVDGTIRHVQIYARDMLGLTELQQTLLFRGSNSLYDIDNAIASIRGDA